MRLVKRGCPREAEREDFDHRVAPRRRSKEYKSCEEPVRTLDVNLRWKTPTWVYLLFRPANERRRPLDAGHDAAQSTVRTECESPRSGRSDLLLSSPLSGVISSRPSATSHEPSRPGVEEDKEGELSGGGAEEAVRRGVEYVVGGEEKAA